MKSLSNFIRKEGVCYSSEDGARTYTYSDILKIAGNSIEYANELFYLAEWQGIETLMEELIKEYDILPIGANVEVCRPSDDTLDSSSIGKFGIVKGYCTNGATGNTKDDPLYIVELIGLPMGQQSYWKDELRVNEPSIFKIGDAVTPMNLIWSNSPNAPVEQNLIKNHTYYVSNVSVDGQKVELTTFNEWVRVIYIQKVVK